jgi:hypothetical protein
MRITEYENPLVWLPPGINCDRPIRDTISDPLPKTASFLGFIGAPGSGKTSLMMSMLTNPDMYHKAFHHIFFVCPATSRASINGDPWKDHPEDKLFDELTPQVLQFVHEFSKVASAEKQYTLLILDDCAAELKNKEIERILKYLVWNRRHLKLTIWIMSQSYIALPLSIRKALSHAIMFRPRNKKETQAIFDELLFLPKEQHELIVNHIFPENDEYGFLFLDTNKGRLHKRFNYLHLAD